MKKFFLTLLFFLITTNLFAFKQVWFLADSGGWEGYNNIITMDNLYDVEPPVYTSEGVTVRFIADENVGEIRSSILNEPGYGVFLFWTQDTMLITPPEGNAITRVTFNCMRKPGYDYFAIASEGTEDLRGNEGNGYGMRWDGCATALYLKPDPRVIFSVMIVNIDEIENIKDGVLDEEEDASGILTIETPSPVEYYNLQGVKVNKDNLTPGIYIVNGKKVLISK